MESENMIVSHGVSWNKGKFAGQKPTLKLRETWAIRTRLQMTSNVREALTSIAPMSIGCFNL
jgi:hypothetical protein